MVEFLETVDVVIDTGDADDPDQRIENYAIFCRGWLAKAIGIRDKDTPECFFYRAFRTVDTRPSRPVLRVFPVGFGGVEGAEGVKSVDNDALGYKQSVAEDGAGDVWLSGERRKAPRGWKDGVRRAATTNNPRRSDMSAASIDYTVMAY